MSPFTVEPVGVIRAVFEVAGEGRALAACVIVLEFMTFDNEHISAIDLFDRW